MPGFDLLEALGPEACRSDPLAPCAYWHLKCRALNGERDTLSRRELDFVGVYGLPKPSGGWRSPTGLYLDEFDTEADPMLQALLMLGQSPLEFLGR